LGIITGTNSDGWSTYQKEVEFLGFAEVVVAALWVTGLFLFRLTRWPFLSGLDF